HPLATTCEMTRNCNTGESNVYITVASPPPVESVTVAAKDSTANSDCPIRVKWYQGNVVTFTDTYQPGNTSPVVNGPWTRVSVECLPGGRTCRITTTVSP